MKNIFYLFLLFATTLLVVSCDNDEDTEAPIIEILKPEENEVVKIGENLKMKFKFSDEYGVRYYSYEIYHQDGVVPGEFHYKKEIELSNLLNEFEIPYSVNVPTMSTDSLPTVTGNYVLRVIARDFYSNVRVVDKNIKIEQN